MWLFPQIFSLSLSLDFCCKLSLFRLNRLLSSLSSSLYFVAHTNFHVLLFNCCLILPLIIVSLPFYELQLLCLIITFLNFSLSLYLSSFAQLTNSCIDQDVHTPFFSFRVDFGFLSIYRSRFIVI